MGRNVWRFSVHYRIYIYMNVYDKLGQGEVSCMIWGSEPALSEASDWLFHQPSLSPCYAAADSPPPSPPPSSVPSLPIPIINACIPIPIPIPIHSRPQFQVQVEYCWSQAHTGGSPYWPARPVGRAGLGSNFSEGHGLERAGLKFI